MFTKAKFDPKEKKGGQQYKPRHPPSLRPPLRPPEPNEIVLDDEVREVVLCRYKVYDDELFIEYLIFWKDPTNFMTWVDMRFCTGSEKIKEYHKLFPHKIVGRYSPDVKRLLQKNYHSSSSSSSFTEPKKDDKVFIEVSDDDNSDDDEQLPIYHKPQSPSPQPLLEETSTIAEIHEMEEVKPMDSRLVELNKRLRAVGEKYNVHLRSEDVLADGNCFYYALLNSINLSSTVSQNISLILPKDAASLRVAISNWLLKNADKPLTSKNPKFTMRSWIEATSYNTLESYSDKVKGDRVWADQYSITAASKLLEVDIYVIMTGSTNKYNICHKVAETSGKNGFVFIANYIDMHYRAVIATKPVK